MIRNNILGLAASLAALALAAPPLAAQEHPEAEKTADADNRKEEFQFLTEEEEAQKELEQELSEAFSIFGALF